VKVVRSDYGKEFTLGPTKKLYAYHGMSHQTNCVDALSQNGIVKRKHRHILNVAKALLFQASLHIKFWGKFVLKTAYLINRTPRKNSIRKNTL